MKVGILGAGAYGKALGFVLRENQHAVYFFDPGVYPERSLEDVVEFSDVILIAVPAEAVRKVLREMPKDGFLKPVVVATKGVMGVEEWERFKKYEIISGPGFASEILNRKRVKLTVAGAGATSEKTLAEELFENDFVKFDKTEDVKGVAMLSGLKNIFAIEAGRRKLENGSAEFKAYIADTLREAEKFLIYNGGFLETVRLSAGVGDFVLTCGGGESRNYQFGLRLREFERERRRRTFFGLTRKLKPEVTTEGVFAAKEIERREMFLPRELEILPNILERIKNATK